jgi:hypothetical protein
MSWEGHLSGFIVGIFFAIYYRKRGIIKEQFEFSKTEFDNLFDEEGNFISPTIEDDNSEEIAKND